MKVVISKSVWVKLSFSSEGGKIMACVIVTWQDVWPTCYTLRTRESLVESAGCFVELVC